MTALTHRHTKFVCYFANFFQAIGSVFPIILVPIRGMYNLSYTQFGLLVTINFITQVSAGLLFSKPVDRLGFRPFIVASPLLSGFGMLLFAATPGLFPGSIFPGFCVGMFLFAMGGGLQELLLSPILDALPLPAKDKARSMSLLHSFFAWGQIAIVLGTTVFLAVNGTEAWRAAVVFWGCIPLISAVLFALVPLYPRVAAGSEMRVKQLFRHRVFLLALLAIVFGGAAEVTMGQWASVFIERGLGLPKLVGDTLGVCGFAFTLALGRTLFGLKGNEKSIHTFMVLGSAGGIASYALAALAPSPVVGLVACGLTGLFVSLLWPGAVIVAGHHLPLAGASMFALLSVSGDLGAALGSFVTGRIADTVQAIPLLNLSGEQAGLRAALLFATLFAVGAFISNLLLRRAAGQSSPQMPQKAE